MWNPGPCAIMTLLAAVPLTGCRLPGREGPVSESLATCRELSQQGIAAAERGQHRQAEALLANAVASCAVDPEARRHYAETLYRRGARQEAIAQLEEAGRLASQDAALRVRLAEMHLSAGQMQHARQSAEHALDLNPKLPAAWAIRGRVMQTNGELRQALADYHRALGYAPNDQQILLQVAELLRQLNRPQRALAALHSLSDTYSPGDEPQQVLHLMGLAYMALGRHEDAVESLSQAVIRDRPTPEIYHRLGEAEWLAGRPVEAAAAARHALALQPQHRPSRELLDRIHLAQQGNVPPRR